MKILLLSSVEHQSGSAIRFRGLAGALARRGHEVHLLEPAVRGVAVETPAGVRRHPCPRLPVAPEWQAPLWLLCGMFAALRVRPDVVWALKAIPNAWIPARVAWLFGARAALDVDDHESAYAPPGPRRALFDIYFRGAVRAADEVTVHSEPLRTLVAAHRAGRSAPVFVEQGIDTARFAAASLMPANERASRRAALGLGDGPVILYAGHLGPASNLGSLLPALALVATAHPASRLLVVGDGRDRRSLEDIAHRSLPRGFAVFVGSVPHADAPTFFALADVAVNYLEPNEANRHRASIKVREALAAGVPVVSTKTPDTARFAAFARLVEPGPPETFVDALLEELAAPDRGRAAAGGAWLHEQGGFDAAVRPIAEIWEQEIKS